MKARTIFQYEERLLGILKTLDEPTKDFYQGQFPEQTHVREGRGFSVALANDLSSTAKFFYHRHPDNLVFNSSISRVDKTGNKPIAMYEKNGQLYWEHAVIEFGDEEMARLEQVAELVKEKYESFTRGVKHEA